jgi:hypothetical protein
MKIIITESQFKKIITEVNPISGFLEKYILKELENGVEKDLLKKFINPEVHGVLTSAEKNELKTFLKSAEGSVLISDLKKAIAAEPNIGNQMAMTNWVDNVLTPLANESPRFNLERTPSSISKPKPKWDYQKRKITDNLEFTANPRGKENVASIKNIKNPEEHIDLKKGTDEAGDYYYMSAKMTNPRDAGIAFTELIKSIPSGSRFGEPAKGSLSTDSFYSMLRRTKNFRPKVKNYIKLNGSGVSKFQPYIKNAIKDNVWPPVLKFKNIEDATVLMNAINDEIKKYNITVLSKIQRNEEGQFEILIPNIQFFIL